MCLPLGSDHWSSKRSPVQAACRVEASGLTDAVPNIRSVKRMRFDDGVPAVTTSADEFEPATEVPRYVHADVGRVHELTRRGIQSTSLSQAVRLGLQFATALLLTRLIPPADFGMVAMAAVLAGFAAVLAESGTQSAIVQRSDLREVHLSAALVINLAMAGCVALVLAGRRRSSRISTHPAGAHRRLGPRRRHSDTALSVVHRGLLERSFRFGVLAAIDVAAAVIASMVSIGLAVAGFGLAAIVAVGLVTAVATTVLAWLCVRWIPAALPTRQAVKDLLGFSGHLLGFNALNYWARNLDNLLVGRFFGAYQAGLYTRSYSLLLLLPLSQVSAIFGRVMLPSLSSVQTDHARVREAYLKALATISCMMTPVRLGLALVAGDFVEALLGPQWAPAVSMIRVFSLLGILQSLTSTVGWLFLSQGKPKRMLVLSIFNTAIVIASFFVGVAIGSAFAVAVCYSIVGVAISYPTVRMAYALIHLPIRSAAHRVAPSFFCSGRHDSLRPRCPRDPGGRAGPGSATHGGPRRSHQLCDCRVAARDPLVRHPATTPGFRRRVSA